MTDPLLEGDDKEYFKSVGERVDMTYVPITEFNRAVRVLNWTFKHYTGKEPLRQTPMNKFTDAIILFLEASNHFNCECMRNAQMGGQDPGCFKRVFSAIYLPVQWTLLLCLITFFVSWIGYVLLAVYWSLQVFYLIWLIRTSIIDQKNRKEVGDILQYSFRWDALCEVLKRANILIEGNRLKNVIFQFQLNDLAFQGWIQGIETRAYHIYSKYFLKNLWLYKFALVTQSFIVLYVLVWAILFIAVFLPGYFSSFKQ